MSAYLSDKAKGHVFKKRLLKLADVLSKLPAKRFDYNQWVGANWEGRPDLSCGTTACAFGWATTIPSLRRAGLRLVKSEDGTGGSVMLKTGNSYQSDHAAAEEVLGLSSNEFRGLFVPSGAYYDAKTLRYVVAPPATATAKQVAKHIRKFVANKYGK